VYELPAVTDSEDGLIEHWYPLGLLVIVAVRVSVGPPIWSCSLLTSPEPVIEEAEELICQVAP
jgi:hypothetical protein